MRPGFLWRVVLPIALGVLLGLWLTAGDNRPDPDIVDIVQVGRR